MAQHALKEWNAVIAAMLAGDQVVMLRKGGIGEKRFDVPHQQFFLLPTHVHQRPELLVPSARTTYAQQLALRDEPGRTSLTAYCTVHAQHEVTANDQLDALAGFHVLGPDYAASRLKWRPSQPLLAIVVRVHTVIPPVPLQMTADMGGCVSWVVLPDDLPVPASDPVLDDLTFTARADAITRALALG